MKIVNFIAAGLLIFVMSSFAGGNYYKTTAQKETQTMKIKTSVVCGECKERIERELVFEKGVKKVKVDIDSKIVTVTYRTDKITPDQIRKAISKLGYWADEIPADEEGFAKLPKCCKDDGCGKK